MAEDGRVYDRSAIEQWLATNEKSPHTNEPMSKKLMPALQVKNVIAKVVESGRSVATSARRGIRSSGKRSRSRISARGPKRATSRL